MLVLKYEKIDARSNAAAMPDLNTLVIFASVVEGRSFSSAARRLHMPLSTVSRRIAQLEAELGGRLLERNSRRLRMTPLGSEVYAQAKIGVDVSEAVASLASDHEHAVSGVIRISSPPNLSDSLLVPLIDAFLERHPGVRVAVFITGRSVDFVEEGVDVGFFVERQFRQSLVHERILRYRHRLVATPQYVAEHGDPRDPEELVANHRIYAFSFWNGWEGWSLTNVGTGEERALDFRPNVAINDFAGIASGLLAGRGIGDLPPIVHPALVTDGKLVEVMCEWRFPIYNFYIAYLGDRVVSRAVRTFTEFAREFVPLLFPDLPT